MSTTIYILIAIAAGSIMFLTKTGRMENDGVFEELVEDVIEEVVHVPIDLSPGDEE